MDQALRDRGVLRGVRVLDARGDFSAPSDVRWEAGRFTSVQPSAASDAQQPERWLIPGLVDAHLHASWHRFDAPERVGEDPDLIASETLRALRATLGAGVTSLRDAGGLTPELLGRAASSASESSEAPGAAAAAVPRAQLSVAMLNRRVVDDAGGMTHAVAEALSAGAQWIKLVATASVTSPPGAGLEPVFSREEMRDAVREADAAGAGVMVHAWGGEAIDHAILAGATSIEHGIFLTPEQARAAAERDLTFVPTLRIYRLVQRMIAQGELPASFAARVDEAVNAHPGAVRTAQDAGLRIALGTDYGTTEQHGSNRLEFDALTAAGLTAAEALTAATEGGAALLRRVDPSAPSGRIAVGEIADALILHEDPRTQGALSATGAIDAIVLGGVMIDPDPKPSQQVTPNREEHP